MRLRLLCFALGGLLASALTLVPAPAAACGGFFCDNGQPVNQQAERIIFAQEPDGTVTAVIQIQYAGPSERFAWMLPVSGRPEIAVSSNAAFTRLQGRTSPTYDLRTRVEGECRRRNTGPGSGVLDAAVDMGMAEADMGTDPGAVTVVDEGSVGPYDFVLIAIDPDAADLVDLAIEWLQDNGYDVPDMGSDVLRPYLEAGQNLLAFRLTKGNDVGAIRPVRLSFGEGLPSIPIRPTAVATVPDMGILVWVLGPGRAVPANYRSLELNEALIDWFQPGRNYDAVVTRAANEAGGQGFVTEMSGSTAALEAVIWRVGDERRWDGLQAEDWAGQHGRLISQTSFLFVLDGAREVVTEHITPPEGVTVEEFLSCSWCFIEPTVTDVEGFDPDAYLADLDEQVVEPMVETQALFERTAVQTRLYTTMSADEMTMDPVFDFNADLPAVPNQHTANLIIECSPAIWPQDAPWRVELESGDVLRGRGNDWPFTLGVTDMPANAVIRRVGPTGTGEGSVVEDNTGRIASFLETHNRTIPGPPPLEEEEPDAPAVVGAPSAGSGFCSASPSPLGAGLLAWGVGALLLRRRRA
ncbi:MAG: DUF2330 domain-containing protein [Myxococcota bacterium]